MINTEAVSPFSSVDSLSREVGISSLATASLEGSFSDFRKQIYMVGIFLKVCFLGPFPEVCQAGVHT